MEFFFIVSYLVPENIWNPNQKGIIEFKEFVG